MYLCHSIEEVGAFDHRSDPLHDIEVDQQVDIHHLAFLLLASHLDLGLSTHLCRLYMFQSVFYQAGNNSIGIA